MRKEELLELHQLMDVLRRRFEDMEKVDFSRYEEVGVGPDDVHDSKAEHRTAVFVLGMELAGQMSEDQFSEAGRIQARMKELAEEVDS